MTAFEFLVTFLSMILAISVGRMIADIGWILASNHKVKASPLYIFGVILLFALQLQYWWASYNDVQYLEGLHFFLFFLYLLPLLLLVLAVDVFLPNRENSDEIIELEDEYWRKSRKIYSMIAIYLATSLALDFILAKLVPSRVPAVGLDAMFRIGSTLLVIWMAWWNTPNRKWLHYVGLSLLAVIFIIYVVIYSPHITDSLPDVTLSIPRVFSLLKSL